MPNSTPELRQPLLDAVGIDDVEELFVQIPPHHRRQGELALPPAMAPRPCSEGISSSCSPRTTPASATSPSSAAASGNTMSPLWSTRSRGAASSSLPVWGTPSSDHGRNQAWFEFASQLGELVGMEFVGLPVYSWGCAEGNAIRMAARITGRDQVLVPRAISPERLAVIRTYCGAPALDGSIEVELVDYDPETGGLDLDDLRAKLSPRTAAILLENPGFLGTIEVNAAEIAATAREAGAETIVGVDPISLGVLAPPGAYGADIVVGSVQPLGVHMSAGGGAGGFIATRDEQSYAHQYPTLNLSIAETTAGEHGFAMTLFHQTSYGSREEGNDWTGNSVYLHAVANAAYMALMGPEGFARARPPHHRPQPLRSAPARGDRGRVGRSRRAGSSRSSSSASTARAGPSPR